MKVGFYTLGCKVNQSESEALMKELAGGGVEVFNLNFERPSGVDFVVINSCAVTEKASLKSLQKIKLFKKKFQDCKIIFTGCLSKLEKKRIQNFGADFIIEDKNEILGKILKQFLNVKIENKRKIHKPLVLHTRYFLKIQTGCSNFCTYCIVPYTRGFTEISKPPSCVLKEIEQETPQEVVLCGINLGHYQAKEQNKNYKLSDLIEKILEETKVKRIRISSINPEDIDLKLVELIKKNSRLAPHLHISIQSGSDKILKKMNRRYSRQEVIDLINYLKNEIPDLNITTDMIVGFPTETEKDFQQTVNLVFKLPFLKVHVFPFSPRQGTVAFSLAGQVPEKVKKERAKILNHIQKIQGENIKKTYLGREFEVLFEEQKNGYWSGFSGNYLRVYKKSNENLKGKFLKVKLKKLFKDGFLV